MMPQEKTDAAGRPWRWGHPLSRDHAESIARYYAEGHSLTPLELKKRHLDQITEELEKGDWNLLNEVRGHMQETGQTTMEVEIDPVLYEHSICEEECAQRWGHLTGADLDERFWECMDQCSPQRNQSYRPEDNPASPEVKR